MNWSIKIKGIVILTFLFFQVQQTCRAQDWNIRYRSNLFDDCRSVIETYDKGIVFPIYHGMQTEYFELVKLDEGSNILWNKKYRFSSGNVFLMTKIMPLAEGGYIVGGLSTTEDTQNGDPALIKLNECFEPEWYVIYNEPSAGNMFADVLELPESHNKIFIFRYFNSSYNTLIKTTSLADTLLSFKTYDVDLGRYNLSGSSIFYLGKTYVNLPHNPSISIIKAINFKVDTNLNTMHWSKVSHLNDTSYYSSFGTSILHSSSKYMVGYINRLPNKTDYRVKTSFYLRMMDTAGVTHWEKLLADTTKNEAPTLLSKISNNKYVVYCQYFPDNDLTSQYYGRMYVVDSMGTVLHKGFVNQRAVNINTSGFTDVHDMIITSDGKILTIGKMEDGGDFDVFCNKYNDDLTYAQKYTSNRTYDSLCNKPQVKDTIYTLPVPKVLSLSKEMFPLDSMQLADAPILSVSTIDNYPEINCIVYPNPFEAGIMLNIMQFEQLNVSLQCRLTDASGREVSKYFLYGAETYISLIGAPAGVYYLVIIDEKGREYGSYKVVKNH